MQNNKIVKENEQKKKKKSNDISFLNSSLESINLKCYKQKKKCKVESPTNQISKDETRKKINYTK